MSDSATRATKRKTTTDLRIEAEPHYSILRCWHRHKTEAESIECRIAEAERWARNFMEFVRDHRSQDLVGLDVVRVTEDQCSACDSAWETTDGTDYEDEFQHCASCGAIVEAPK